MLCLSFLWRAYASEKESNGNEFPLFSSNIEKQLSCVCPYFPQRSQKNCRFGCGDPCRLRLYRLSSLSGE